MLDMLKTVYGGICGDIAWKELLAVYGVIAVAVAGCTVINKARAQDTHEHVIRDTMPHERYHDWYKTWMQPDGSGVGCCSATEYYTLESGKRVLLGGDCEPTEAELRRDKDGRPEWWARVSDHWVETWNVEPWVRIPEEKIIREINPEPNSAHLCYTPAIGVLCFVPPFGGY